MTELLIAFVLLTGADGDPVPKTTIALAPQIQALALSMELLDKRETRYILNRPEDFESDINLIRRRWLELHDAPPVGDAYRLPLREAIQSWMVFNREYCAYLDLQIDYNFRDNDVFKEMKNEATHLYYIWDMAVDARCEYYYVSVRRSALKRLRTALGPADYYSCRWPPFVPIWRFQDITSYKK